MKKNSRVKTKKYISGIRPCYCVSERISEIVEAIFFLIIPIVVVLLKAKLKKVKKKKKRGEGESLDEGRPYVTKIFAKFSHDAPLPMVKKKHLTIEQLNARRRKVWLTIAKKEIPKVSIPKAMEELSEITAGLLFCYETLILICCSH